MLSPLLSVWENGSGGSAAVVLSLLLVVAFVVAFVLGQLLVARAFSALERLGEKGAPRLRHQLERLTATLQTGLNGALFIFLSLFFVPSVLRLYPSTKGLGMRWNGLLEEREREIFTEILEYLPKLVFLLVVIVATRVILGLLKQVFLSVEGGQIRWNGFEPAWAPPTFQILRVVVFLFAIILAFPYLPASNTDAFKAIGVFAGVLLSFGSSGAVSNATAGLALTYERAFREGDYVVLNGKEGTIERIGVLTTRMRTLKNECIVIPNQTILTSTIVNYNYFEEGVAIGASATIGYDVEWRKVHEIMQDAARRFAARREFTHGKQQPRILQTALNDFHVGYTVEVFVVAMEDRELAETALHESVRDAFDAAGVAIMSPAQTALHFPKTLPAFGAETAKSPIAEQKRS